MEERFWQMKPTVVRYNEEWPKEFEKEKNVIQECLGDSISLIEHFGSTSVPGMWAKPIIDMQAVLKSMSPSEEILTSLKKIGYIHRPTIDVSTEEYIRFDKGDPIVTHCLHLRNRRGEQSVAYRDYLRQHPEDVERYSQVKLQILQNPNITMKEYRAQKTSIIQEIAAKAYA
eukprot:TRINITY_DN12998_c0_g1_i1.p1 TRINITY_DN12998_c0_g1~~TRINITY_DN12998_c0_g1_i1.p1  ORF type:complete len:172 (+),score=25.10 TRINITY_DN12998_c0_g1_i1:193-708(+)